MCEVNGACSSTCPRKLPAVPLVTVRHLYRSSAGCGNGIRLRAVHSRAMARGRKVKLTPTRTTTTIAVCKARRSTAQHSGNHRVVPPRETCRRARPAMKTIGVTRLADVTGLDYVGIPVWAAVRPLADDSSISVQNGKGPTPMHARAGAMMEAIEHYCCERPAPQAHVLQLSNASSPGRMQSIREV